MIPLGDYMKSLESDEIYQGFMRVITVHRTRRMVLVTRRKYLARKRRKR